MAPIRRPASVHLSFTASCSVRCALHRVCGFISRSHSRQSVHGYLFFAGEATSVYAPSTVVGAMESAAAAVDELISTANVDDHVAPALTRARIEATEEDASHEEEVEAQRYAAALVCRHLIHAAPSAGPITAEAVIRSAKL